MSDTGESDPDSSELSPEQRLNPPDTRLINAGIATIKDFQYTVGFGLGGLLKLRDE